MTNRTNQTPGDGPSIERIEGGMSNRLLGLLSTEDEDLQPIVQAAKMAIVGMIAQTVRIDGRNPSFDFDNETEQDGTYACYVRCGFVVARSAAEEMEQGHAYSLAKAVEANHPGRRIRMTIQDSDKLPLGDVVVQVALPIYVATKEQQEEG